jgi:hypothetical protein
VKTINTLKKYINFGIKLFHDMKKKGQNVRHIMGKVNKKVNLGVLGVNPYVQRGYLNHAWINTMDNLDNVYT